MRRTLALASTLLLAASALAGCMGGDDDPNANDPTPDATPTGSATPPTATSGLPTPSVSPPPPVLDASTYTLTMSGVPGQAKPGAFNFTLDVNGTVETSSDHIGAHYGADGAATPNASAMTACTHVSGALPGTYVVECPDVAPGAWYVWGHARVNDTDGQRSWWSAEPVLVKVRDYQLDLSGVPSNPPTSGSNFTLTLTVEGTDNDTMTNHLGAHFWNATQASPTVQNSAGACQHVPQETAPVGTFTITCSIEHSGVGTKDFFLRAHLRLVEGGTTLDWWGPETKVSIVGVPI